MPVNEKSAEIVSSLDYSPETFFFFQAEDGIRDLYVTGVQTCALPIWSVPPSETWRMRSAMPWRRERKSWQSRSEERRVGKECRWRRSLYFVKKYCAWQ